MRGSLLGSNMTAAGVYGSGGISAPAAQQAGAHAGLRIAAAGAEASAGVGVSVHAADSPVFWLVVLAGVVVVLATVTAPA